MNNLKQIMEGKSDRQLLSILEHEQHKFSGEAIAAVKEVLKERNLSLELTNEIKQSLQEDIEKKVEKKKTKQSISFGRTINDSLDAPTQTDHSVRRDIRLITMVLFLYLCYQLYSNITSLLDFFFISNFPFQLASIIVTNLLLLVAIVGLYNYRKFGWIISVVYSCLISISSILSIFYMLLSLNEISGTLLEDMDYYKQGMIRSIGITLFVFMLAITLILYLWKKPVKELFSIERKVALNSIYAGSGLALILWSVSYWMMNL